jgi:copper resistance protein C
LRVLRLACALVLLLAPVAAAAHAILEQSQPANGGSVAVGKLDIVFTYNSRIDQDRSRLTLIGPDRHETVLHLSAEEPPNVLGATVNLTTPGAYVVRWQVLAIDGHITRGDVPFVVTGQ